MKVRESALNTSTFVLEFYTTAEPEFIDITERVSDCIRESGIANGFVVVFSKHTTAGITIQEHEPLLLQDLANTLERFAPSNAHYRHNDFSVRTVHMHEDECPNGHSHCQHLLLGTSESIPVIDGRLPLGKWQRIFMVELDKEAEQPRQVLVQILGM